MAITQYQCQNCGQQGYSDNKFPPTKNCCENKMWKPIEGAPAKNNKYFQCILCGLNPHDVTKKNNVFYPFDSSQCNQHKKGITFLPHVWVMVGLQSFDYKKWRCRNCNINPQSNDFQLKQKGFPSISNCRNSKSGNHVWQRIY